MAGVSVLKDAGIIASHFPFSIQSVPGDGGAVPQNLGGKFDPRILYSAKFCDTERQQCSFFFKKKKRRAPKERPTSLSLKTYLMTESSESRAGLSPFVHSASAC